MACSSSDEPEGGYATISAVCFSLALGLVVTALMHRSVSEMSAARADLIRAGNFYLLDGSHQAAGLDVSLSTGQGPYRWSLVGEFHGVRVLAEPEVSKLTIAAAADLDQSVFDRLQVRDADDLRGRLRTLAAKEQPMPADVENADASLLWRACARSMISPYGKATALAQVQAGLPVLGPTAKHAGELWRLRLVSPDGWSDDRLVRLTGDAAHPAAVVERRFVRQGARAEQCETMIYGAETA